MGKYIIVTVASKLFSSPLVFVCGGDLYDPPPESLDQNIYYWLISYCFLHYRTSQLGHDFSETKCVALSIVRQQLITIGRAIRINLAR